MSNMAIGRPSPYGTDDLPLPSHLFMNLEIADEETLVPGFRGMFVLSKFRAAIRWIGDIRYTDLRLATNPPSLRTIKRQK